jgi:hypothetical protein
LAKAQGIPADRAKAQVLQYQQQYKDAVAQTKEQAKQAADTTGVPFGALALVLSDLAAFFAGQASAVTLTVLLMDRAEPSLVDRLRFVQATAGEAHSLQHRKELKCQMECHR